MQVDIAFIPFVERFQIFLYEQFKYDITAGRPKLAAWIEVSYELMDCCTHHSNVIDIQPWPVVPWTKIWGNSWEWCVVLTVNMEFLHSQCHGRTFKLFVLGCRINIHIFWLSDNVFLPWSHHEQEMNKIEAYTQTKTDPKELVEFYKKRFMVVL